MTIKERITRPEDFKYIYGDFPVEYLYTAGTALDPFFKSLKEKGKFIGSKCNTCDFTYVPPTTFCEQCFRRIEKTVNISDTGILESFTISYLDVDGNRLSEPELWGLVRLNGASTILVHRLLCKLEDACIGMVVAAKFKPKNKRVGGMEDIEGFVAKKKIIFFNWELIYIIYLIVNIIIFLTHNFVLLIMHLR
jgi:uncharacterized OB-fold protein